MYRIGQGYDVHRLVPDRELRLCGVKIPYELGLLGHSDADVAIHALCDAILGALAMRDIGYHFPDTSEEFDGADSRLLLARVCEMMRGRGYEIGNVDVTICAQRPKLAPFIEEMRQMLASVMGTEAGNVSVKATTTERLGFEGRGEGISSMAVALLRKAVAGESHSEG